MRLGALQCLIISVVWSDSYWTFNIQVVVGAEEEEEEEVVVVVVEEEGCWMLCWLVVEFEVVVAVVVVVVVVVVCASSACVGCGIGVVCTAWMVSPRETDGPKVRKVHRWCTQTVTAESEGGCTVREPLPSRIPSLVQAVSERE
jgi:hypothetical protein